jgi:hypothetical protein
MPWRTTGGRTLATAAVRAGYGAALLLLPERLLALGTPAPVPGAAVAVARVLGARHVLQSVVTVLVPTGRVATAGALVDALHGSTGVGLAAVSPRWRPVALADATVATVLAAATWSQRGDRG